MWSYLPWLDDHQDRGPDDKRDGKSQIDKDAKPFHGVSFQCGNVAAFTPLIVKTSGGGQGSIAFWGNSALRHFCHASRLRPCRQAGMTAAMTHDDIQDMATLRAHIDALDARLIALLAERSGLIDRAAQIKARDGLPARIEARVEEVALLARTRAADAGLSPDLAESLWRLMMEHFIAQGDAQLGGKDGGNPDRR